MDIIEIWGSRTGDDPVTHFWFEPSESTRQRICDGAEWVREPKGEADLSDVFVPCRPCREIYLKDVLSGLQVMYILTEPPPEILRPTPEILRPTPEKMISFPGEREVTMTRLPMSSFAKFYESRPAEQVSIVRQIRTNLTDPERYRYADYYMSLRNTLKATHWRNGSIDQFEDALEVLLDRIDEPRKREHYRTLGHSYIKFWKMNADGFFTVPPLEMEVAGLTILIRPEVGIEIGGDQQVLKLWFNRYTPTRQARQILLYLMDRVCRQDERWRNYRHFGVWDIRRERIPLPLRTARDFEIGLLGQIAAFKNIWSELDREAENFEIGE